MGILEHLDYYLNQNIDPRTKVLPFVESNYIIPSIVILYLYIVLKWGPNYMKNKPPYNMKTFIRYYNVFQILMNGYVTMRFIQLGVLDVRTRVCYPVDYLLDPISVQVAITGWLGWTIRIVDLVETVIFVLRKKDKQISFLHVYHHTVVTLLGWYIARFYANQMAAFHTLVNSIVHTVMYTYYFCSSLDKAPKILSSIKPYITIMQMVQFIILLIHILSILLLCNVPTKIPVYAAIVNLIINLILFYNFYRKAYSVQQKQKK